MDQVVGPGCWTGVCQNRPLRVGTIEKVFGGHESPPKRCAPKGSLTQLHALVVLLSKSEKEKGPPFRETPKSEKNRHGKQRPVKTPSIWGPFSKASLYFPLNGPPAKGKLALQRPAVNESPYKGPQGDI